MAIAMNALDLIDEQLTRAATPRPSNRKPVFLFLKEGHKAVIRPLFDLKDAVVLKKHNKWSDNPEERVNAICAVEEGKPCIYCQKAEYDKKPNAQLNFYLPVYVYGVVDQSSGEKVTYKEKDESGNEVAKPVQGVRLLELSAFGTVGQILKWIREFMRDEDNCKITECDFNFTQAGSGQKKAFILMNKAPKPMPEQLKAVVSTINPDNVRARILEALPPVIAEEGYAPAVHAAKVATADTSFDDTIIDGF